MSDTQSILAEMISTLKQHRDEIGLQIHLGKSEAKEEYDRARVKLDELMVDYEPVKDAVGESAENVLESLKLVGEELLQSFRRIRDAGMSDSEE